MAAPREEGFLEQFAATYRFGAGTPRGISITPDGAAVLFLRSGPRSVVQDLYELDAVTGAERVLLTADQILKGGAESLSVEEKARRERMRVSSRGIASYSLSKDGSTILVPLSGKLYLVDRASAKVREVGSGKGFPIDPRFSEDGSKIGCVRDGDLHVIDVATGNEIRLTSRADENIEYGVAEFVAAEEMDRREGYWFSPDGTNIAFTVVDTTGLERFTIADPVNPERPATTWAYPRPGKANAKVGLMLSPVALGPAVPVQWDHAKYPYLVSVKWPKNAPLTIVVSNRAQTEQVIYAVSDSGSVSELLTEKDSAWVEIRQSVPRWLGDGSGFLWITESSGWPELEWRDKSGTKVSTLAGEAIGFRGIIDVDDQSGDVYVSASKDPTESHVWRVPTTTRNAPQPLTVDPGQHGMSFSKNHQTWVRSSSTADGRRAWVVGRNEPSRPDRIAPEIKCVAEKPPFMPKPEWITVRAGDRVFHAYVLRPRDFDGKKKYPVIDSVYAGPTANVVAKSPWGQLLNQWIADHGFIVVGLDNRGTELRGRDWARAWKTRSGNPKGDLIDIALADHADGIQALVKQYPEMDGARVGVYGWSFGGYFSAMAAMRRPDVFRAACAGAPVAAWEDYDTTYTERYLGLPQDNPEGYRNSSVLTWAKDLSVPFLLVHGTADDNVYFMHSLKMADAMFRAGRHFEFLVLPGFTHMVPDPVVTRSLYSRIADFFVTSLGGPK
ncbi:MAG: DPP IV N-terminal domain-containing protein [Phycisphaerae bacterium]|nr:DPP IV N-terminal domain-containing protein [Phycisphaerae bacterium]